MACPPPKRQRYRDDTRNLLRKGGEESVRERLQDAVAVGSETFRNKIKRLADGGHRETSGKRELRQRVTFEEALRAVERVRGEERAQFLNRYGDGGTPLAMWLARRYCGMTLREIGAALGGKDYAAVSDRLRRFERQLATDKSLRKARNAAVRVLNLEI